MFIETMTHQSSPLLFLQLMFGHHGLYAVGSCLSRKILQIYSEMAEFIHSANSTFVHH